jgi:hypothetical protein
VQIARIYGEKPREQMNGEQIARNNVLKREFEREYLEYWNTHGHGTPCRCVCHAGGAVCGAEGDVLLWGYTTAISLLG